MNHLTALAHVALYTKDLETSINFYKQLGGTTAGRADVIKQTGVNHLAMIAMPGFSLEIIEPHDGSPVTNEGGLFPHLAIETDDIEAAIVDLKAIGVTTFRTEKPVDMPTLFGGIRNIFFTGPDGELLELVEHIK